MKKFGSGRVSPALVISIAALVLAAGGTSFASAPVAFIAKAVGLNGAQKKQVKSIADKEIKSKASKLSVLFAKAAGSAASAGSAATAGSAASAANATNATNATNLGGQPSSAYEPHAVWALVNATGTIAAQSGGIRVSFSEGGDYYLNLGMPTTGKALIVSASDKDEALRGPVLAAPCGGPPQGIVCTVPGTNDVNHVFVFTEKPGDTSPGEPNAFYITLLG